MAEVDFASRFSWFDAVISGPYRGSEVRVAWAIVRAVDERTGAAALIQPDIARDMMLGKKTVEHAVQRLRNEGYLRTDLRAGPRQANLYRLMLPASPSSGWLPRYPEDDHWRGPPRG